ncbi:MAG: winged helix-turn-helix domain-containing protein [Pseudomonadota bacterium]
MTIIKSDDLIVDTAQRSVHLNKIRIDVGGLTYDLLLTLLDAAPAAISHDDIAARVWPNRVLTPDTLSQRIRLLRNALDDHGRPPKFVRSVRGFGYQWIPTVEQEETAAPAWSDIAFGEPKPQDLRTHSHRHALAVLPFATRSDEQATSDRALGIQRDLIGRLARTGAFPVTALASTLMFQPGTHAPTDVATRLGVRFLLLGELVSDKNKTTIAMELVDGQTGESLWQDQLTDWNRNTLDLGEALFARITAEIESRIVRIARQDAMLPTANLDAWTAYHRGCWHMYWFTPDALDSAERWFEVARQLDPGASRPLACLSWVHWQRVFLGVAADAQKSIAVLTQFAEDSLSLNEVDPLAHWAQGRAMMMNRDLDAANIALKRSVELNPSFSVGHYTVSFAQLQLGELDASEHHATRAAELSPFDPLLCLMLTTQGFARTLRGEFDAGAEKIREAIRQPNVHFAVRAKAAVAFSLAGNANEARDQLSLIRQSRPDFDAAAFASTFQYRDPEYLDLFNQAFDKIA